MNAPHWKNRKSALSGGAMQAKAGGFLCEKPPPIEKFIFHIVWGGDVKNKKGIEEAAQSPLNKLRNSIFSDEENAERRKGIELKVVHLIQCLFILE